MAPARNPKAIHQKLRRFFVPSEAGPACPEVRCVSVTGSFSVFSLCGVHKSWDRPVAKDFWVSGLGTALYRFGGSSDGFETLHRDIRVSRIRKALARISGFGVTIPYYTLNNY